MCVFRKFNLYQVYIMSANPTTSQMESKMNGELYMRNVPSTSLQPYINVRPVSTKYSIMPIVDPRARINVPLKTEPIYDINTTFNPGNNTAPWSGYASRVNVESELKNQIFALQNCEQSVYVPKSNSDLYHTSVPVGPNVQSHPLLFAKQQFEHCDPSPGYAQKKLFNHSTRADTKDSHNA